MPLIPPLGPPIQIPISNDTPGRIQIAKYLRNGLVPHASFTSQISRSANFVAALRLKEMFSWACPIVDIPAATTTRERWRFAAHTSPRSGAVTVVFYMAQTDVGIGSPGSNPHVTLTLTDDTGVTTYGTATMYYGATLGTPSDIPSEFGYGSVTILGVPVDTTVYGVLEENGGGRLISACVYEQGQEVTAANGYVIPSAVAAGSPIWGGRQQDLYEMTSDMWRRQGAHLFNWTADSQSTPRTTTSTTAVGLLEGGTVPATATMGWMLDTRNCGTRARPNTVPCLFAARSKMDAGTGRIKLKDAAGTTLATLTVTGTSPAWYSVAVDLDSVEGKYYVTHEADSTRTISTYAASLFQHAT